MPAKQSSIFKFLKRREDFSAEERAAEVAAGEKRKAEAAASAEAARLMLASKRGSGRPPGKAMTESARSAFF